MPHLRSDGHLDLDTGLDVNNDLLDDLGRGVQVDQSLVDAHLVHVPGLGPLTAGRLSRRDLERLGGQAHGALDAQVLGLCALEQLGAHFLQRLDFAAREGDADFVDFLVRMSRRVSAWNFLRRGKGCRLTGKILPGPRQSPCQVCETT